jgi:Integrase core domain
MEKLAMEARREMVRHHAKAYQGARKGEKRKFLDMFVEATGYNRVYAARLLRQQGRRVWIKPGLAVVGDGRVRVKRRRPKVYGPEVVEPLKRIWRMLDYPCGKRLAPALAGVVPALERHRELRLAPEVRSKLLRISGASIDRLLAQEKRKNALKARSRTKPGSLLKSQIPVRTFAQWDEQAPGFLEVDLVAHDGGCAQGDFVQTLDATDVCTGWSEQRAVLNKAQQWVFEALVVIGQRLPFPLRGLDSDNGSEFINSHLLAFCQEHRITFTRARPYRKNDTCYVEQKNYSIVRRTVGYGRFTGSPAVQTLNTLYERVSLRSNFFLPSMKLLNRHRQGSRVVKHHDTPRTPCQRVLDSPHVDSDAKAQLKRRYRQLNPAALDRQIRALQSRLARLTRPVATVSSLLPPGKERSPHTPPRATKEALKTRKKGGPFQIHFT